MRKIQVAMLPIVPFAFLTGCIESCQKTEVASPPWGTRSSDAQYRTVVKINSSLIKGHEITTDDKNKLEEILKHGSFSASALAATTLVMAKEKGQVSSALIRPLLEDKAISAPPKEFEPYYYLYLDLINAHGPGGSGANEWEAIGERLLPSDKFNDTERAVLISEIASGLQGKEAVALQVILAKKSLDTENRDFGLVEIGKIKRVYSLKDKAFWNFAYTCFRSRNH